MLINFWFYSEEEAKRSIYSVSTKYYYAFGCEIDENVVHSVKCITNILFIYFLILFFLYLFDLVMKFNVVVIELFVCSYAEC